MLAHGGALIPLTRKQEPFSIDGAGTPRALHFQNLVGSDPDVDSESGRIIVSPWIASIRSLGYRMLSDADSGDPIFGSLVSFFRDKTERRSCGVSYREIKTYSNPKSRGGNPSTVVGAATRTVCDPIVCKLKRCRSISVLGFVGRISRL